MRSMIVLFILAAVPALAQPACPPNWPADCLVASHPHHLVYQPWDNRLLIAVCYTTPPTDPAVCVDNPNCCTCPAITRRQWCQEKVALPLPAGAPQSAIRPHLEVCDRALAAGVVSGEPGG